MTIMNRVDKEQKILELREALTRLEDELQKDIELEQHQAIENLDEHFNAVETKLNNLKTFWSMLKSEWRHTSS
jgi:predicted component of type VI protein secretion system